MTFESGDGGRVDDAASFALSVQRVVFHRKSAETDHVKCSDEIRFDQFLSVGIG